MGTTDSQYLIYQSSTSPTKGWRFHCGRGWTAVSQPDPSKVSNEPDSLGGMWKEESNNTNFLCCCIYDTFQKSQVI